MSNVVNLFEDEIDLKHCSYFEDCRKVIGVCSNNEELVVLPVDSSEFMVVLGDESRKFSREQLAEFIHVASCLIDSEDRFKPDVDLIGRNYE